MISKKKQGMVMIVLGVVLVLVIIDHDFFKVLFGLVGVFLISYGLQVMGKPSISEYVQRLFNALKS